jgi:hypothetical protein
VASRRGTKEKFSQLATLYQIAPKKSQSKNKCERIFSLPQAPEHKTDSPSKISRRINLFLVARRSYKQKHNITTSILICKNIDKIEILYDHLPSKKKKKYYMIIYYVIFFICF